jgi:hypothetical protein
MAFCMSNTSMMPNPQNRGRKYRNWFLLVDRCEKNNTYILLFPILVFLWVAEWTLSNLKEVCSMPIEETEETDEDDEFDDDDDD